MSNICTMDARAWPLNAEEDIASALKEHIKKSFYTQQCIAVEVYLSEKAINATGLEMPFSCLET